MNGMNFKPFITKVLDSLSDKDVGDLYELINKHSDNFTNRSLVDSSNLLTTSDKGVGLFTIQLDFETIRSGYLLYNNSYCVLLAYVSNSERVVEFVIANNSYKPVKEYLTTDFLRHEVAIRAIEVGQQGSITVQADDIDSENATEGQVLTADGEGGAEWTNKVDYLVLVGDGGGTLSDDDIALAKQNNTVARYGDGGEIYYKNSQNNYYIVFKATARVAGDDTIVEKLTLNLTEKTWSYSYDVVAAGESFTPEYDAALNEGSENAVQNKVITKALEDKANVDGNYPTLTAGLADNLTPYSEDSGDTQDNPFISQGTGTNNNNEIVTVGDYGLLKEKQGHTLVVNQKFRNDYTINTEQYGLTFVTTTGTNSITISGTATDSTYRFWQGVQNIVAGHKYLIVSNTTKIVMQLSWYNGSTWLQAPVNGSGKIYAISTAPAGADNLKVVPNFTATEVYNETDSVYLINLTQMFNGDIPQDLLDHPEHFSWYYNGDLSYKSGTLVNANTERLVSTGRQLWDEEWEVGAYDSSGNKADNNTTIRSKNKIRVVPNTTYYFRSPTYGYYICYYDINETIIERTSWKDHNTTFTTPNNCAFVTFNMSGYGTTYNNDITISLYYTPEQGGEGYSEYYPYEAPYVVDTGDEVLRQAGSVKDYKTPDGVVHRLVGNRVYQSGDENDSSLITDGTTTNYPLESSTTEQGTTFSENLPINDYGMLYWQESNGVPQGVEIFYPVNYKGFLDDVYSRTSGDAEQLVIQSDLSARDTVDAQLQNAIGGTLRQCLCVKESLDFDNTAFIDLGTLTWTYYGTSPSHFSASLSGVKVGTTKILCTKYKAVASGGGSSLTTNMTINIHNSSAYVQIKDDAYTDADTFKNAMKGVLLAYEKGE